MNRSAIRPILTGILLSLAFIPDSSAQDYFSKLELKNLLPERQRLNLVTSREPEYYSRSDATKYLKDNALLYLESGLKGFLVTAYYKSGDIITVEIYNMGSIPGAYSIYKSSRIPKDHDFKVGDGSIHSKSSIIFWQAAYFVKLITLSQDENTIASLRNIAKAVSKRIPYHTKPPQTVRVMPTKDLVQESVEFAMGPVGFKKFFKFFPDGAFDKDEDVGQAAIARYKGKDDFDFCLMEYPNEFRAELTLNRIAAKLKENGIDHYYLFDVMLYSGNGLYFKVDRIKNFVSIFRYKDKGFDYKRYLDRVREKI